MKNLTTWISLSIFVIGIIAGAGKLIAQTSINEKRLDGAEEKIAILAISAGKIETKQEIMADQQDKMADKIDKIFEVIVSKKK